MEKPAEQPAQLPYGEVEALQPYYQQLDEQYQVFMDDHQKLQDRYHALVEHHDLLEKLDSELRKHRYRLQDQNEVLEGYQQALEGHEQMVNRKNEVIAAPQAEPPSSFGSMPNSSCASVSRAVLLCCIKLADSSFAVRSSGPFDW
jgi:predicted nuclease with TOPRIM domain